MVLVLNDIQFKIAKHLKSAVFLKLTHFLRYRRFDWESALKDIMLVLSLFVDLKIFSNYYYFIMSIVMDCSEIILHIKQTQLSIA